VLPCRRRLRAPAWFVFKSGCEGAALVAAVSPLGWGSLLTEADTFPRITALLTAHGHSPDQAAAIVLHARHNYAPARQWIKVLAGADAARARYQWRSDSPFRYSTDNSTRCGFRLS